MNNVLGSKSQQLLPFIFGRYNPKSTVADSSPGFVVKDWVVKIALPSFTNYDSHWMCDEKLGDICCIPDVDIVADTDKVFNTFAEARYYVGAWWAKQMLVEVFNLSASEK